MPIEKIVDEYETDVISGIMSDHLDNGSEISWGAKKAVSNAVRSGHSKNDVVKAIILRNKELRDKGAAYAEEAYFEEAWEQLMAM